MVKEQYELEHGEGSYQVLLDLIAWKEIMFGFLFNAFDNQPLAE